MQNKKEHVNNWLLSKAYKMLENDTSDDAMNWKSYAEQHALESITAWSFNE